jgi:hypothetical protein
MGGGDHSPPTLHGVWVDIGGEEGQVGKLTQPPQPNGIAHCNCSVLLVPGAWQGSHNVAWGVTKLHSHATCCVAILSDSALLGRLGQEQQGGVVTGILPALHHAVW